MLSMAQVIAVPAHFNEQQRRATLKAAHLAGLEQVQLLQGACNTKYIAPHDPRLIKDLCQLSGSLLEAG